VIKSMTGCGAAPFAIGEDRFTIEIKSVNHRFLEINIRVPDRFFLLENKIRDIIKKSCSRGSLSISIISRGETAGQLKPNIPLARYYVGVIRELQRELGLKQEEIDISLILRFKDIFSFSSIEHNHGMDWTGLKSGLEGALNDLLKMRGEEGCALAKDIGLRLNYMGDFISKMEKRAPIISETYREKLRQRMTEILDCADIEETRLLTEVAVFAERCTITEELVRLKSHVTQFKGMLEADEQDTYPKDGLGRKADFICQELLREINTIGSKANDFELSTLVISAKAELEKIREQVQNVE
jgi:uncharacterized protein (TIGR00255 family)